MSTDERLTGSAGEARRVPDDLLRPSLTGAQAATLAYWWVFTPGIGMIVVHANAEPTSVADVKSLEIMVSDNPRDRMETFSLGLITLADLPGVPPAKKMWPWVTHEMIVFTLDTTTGPVDMSTPLPWPTLQPHNISVQFQVHDDDQAVAVARDIVKAIVNGFLPAEVQAFVPERHKMMTLAPLRALWHDTVDQLAEHHRTAGAHDEHPDR